MMKKILFSLAIALLALLEVGVAATTTTPPTLNSSDADTCYRFATLSTKELTGLDYPFTSSDAKITRIDRQINSRSFIYKGEWMVGFNGSYGELSTDDASIMLVVDNLSATLNATKIEPYFGYFYRDNRAVGIRLGYNSLNGTIDTGNFDLGTTNDINFDLPYINTEGRYYSAGVYHRAYANLDNNGHFGLFAEVELMTTFGESTFEYMSGDVMHTTTSDNLEVNLSFNPGISAFLFRNVCASLSFEFGGFNYTSIRQYDELGNESGSREAAKLRFKLNMLALNFGITVHFW